MQGVKDNTFLGTEPLGRLLFRLAIPTIAAQLINMLYNVVDRIYIGHIPEIGGLALTGLGVCMPIILFVSAFACLISTGGAPRASIFMGRGERENAERTMGSCFTMQIIVSIILTVILLVFGRDMLLLFGASENTIEYAADYLHIYALGTIFVELTLGMNAYITAQGFASVGMRTVLIGAILNIILDPLFIYGFNLGVKGAALATIISQAVSCAWVLFFLFSKKSILRLTRESVRVDFKLFLPCVLLGMAQFIMQSSESVICICFNSSLLKYGNLELAPIGDMTGGDVAVGAMTILTSVMQFAMLPLQGLGQGAQPIISYNYGARNGDRVKGIFRLLLTVSLIYSVSLWALIMIFPEVFSAIFASEAALVGFAAKALRIYCAVLCIFGVQIACQMTFVSLGKAGSSVTVAVVRKFVLLLPLIYVMPAIFTSSGTMAIYLAEPVADFLAVSFTALLFVIQFKHALAKIEGACDDFDIKNEGEC